ncbi:RING finger protein [Nannizzia gypsea CBS 118893]|uniref:RING finger protein n=1 Tax=Arthroderma gypseum (strain ATCC MYA-4604 / CBS 118893) TaxID=535722 RepID=E4V3U0_ARTGP|nr:RING finger protein [Nannizzia gypsea CBS 118893]EFR04664.1 RING finger protein [Nannizzia gypsea CBS 118893]
MTTAAPPTCPSTSTPSFGSRLRRLSQRRPQTQSNGPVQGSSASANHRSYRKRLSWVVGRGSSHLPAAPEGEEDGEPNHHHHHQHQHNHDIHDGDDHDHRSSLQQQENSDLLHAELDRSASAELESSSQRYSVFSRSDAESSESSTSEDRPEQLAEAGFRSRRHQQASLSQDTTSYTMAQALNMASVVVGAAASSPISPSAAAIAAADTSNSGSGRAPDQPTTSSTAHHSTSQNGHSSSGTGDSTETSMSASNSPDQQHQDQQSIIRFFAYQDPHQNSRPSLPFAPMTRTITDESAIIKVGRYSEREGIPAEGAAGSSSAPVGFKSKVVSRKHCEFSFIGGQWHIKDVGSSSGTFLNHMRLSQPNVPSRQYAVRDGDIVQLGIDFRGGEELIFRCVRIRIECNRMWQQRANQFNKNTEALITNLGKGSMDATDYEGCRECSICLGSVLRPYQCLFMAACAHVWHYKCIRRLIHSPEYPMFQCPNCRAYTDLNAEVDDSNDPYEEKINPSPNTQPQQQPQQPQQPQQQPQQQQQRYPPQPLENNTTTTNTTSRTHTANNSSSAPPIVYTHTETDGPLATATGNMTLESDPEPEPEPEHDPSDGPDGDVFHPAVEQPLGAHSNDVHRSQNIDILSPNSNTRTGMGRRRVPDRANRDTIYVEDPLTPRNDTGLLALDGRAGRL